MGVVRYCVLLLALLLSIPCFAQRKVALETILTGDDPAGMSLVAALREAVRLFESPPAQGGNNPEAREPYGMRLMSGVSRPRIRLQLQTAALPDHYTAVAVNITYDSSDTPLQGAFIRSMFETCSETEHAACAQRILLKATPALDWLRDNWPSLWRTL